MQPAIPPGLKAELDRREATVLEVRPAKKGRHYVLAESPTGPLFGRFGQRSDYEPVLAHEMRVRAAIGTDLPLRSPLPVAFNTSWSLETRVYPAGFEGAAHVTALVAAVEALMSRDLPHAPRPKRPSPVRRLIHKLSPKDTQSHPLWVEFKHALRLLDELQRGSKLPLVTSHGDLTPSNVLMDEDGPWIVDWERLGIALAGADLMRFWPFVEAPRDRERLWDEAVGLIGSKHVDDLRTLRYVYLVKAAVTKAGLRRSTRNEDPAAAARLMDLLPEVREQARTTSSSARNPPSGSQPVD